MTFWSKCCLGWIKYPGGQCLHIRPLRYTPAHQSWEPRAALAPCTPSSNFLLLFLTLFIAKSKYLLFHGEWSILICLKPMFHSGFFSSNIHTSIHIDLHIWYKRCILRKTKQCFPMFEHASFLKNFASWKKVQSFLCFGLTALNVVLPDRQKIWLTHSFPHFAPHLTGCCCDHKKDGNRC